ncbi:Homoserine O-succinyltransferase [uncultured Candidatus Thioglobus sp.]|nr:Homoserine O-succinyltransferase [uncultured Candidatus Thioglobus sp.]
MPLVANVSLPSFTHLQQEGATVISRDQAEAQDIRELHIGLLNMMPDKALVATERQFFRLVGESNQIAQFYMHPFTLKELVRGAEGQAYVTQHYQSFEQIQEEGLDALIITGANVTGLELSDQPFWFPLNKVIDWAYENVTSTLLSCLATHTVLEFRYQQKRSPLVNKRWGVYPHFVTAKDHPLVLGVNTRFDVPHSRFNTIEREQFIASNLQVLVESETAGVHLAVSEDGFRMVFFQGHPEYDTVSLLKEYKREIGRYANKEIDQYPSIPENYFSLRSTAILQEFANKIKQARADNSPPPPFPEALIVSVLDNTWRDSAEAVINKWIGKVYQITNIDQRKPFHSTIDPQDPLGLKNS